MSQEQLFDLGEASKDGGKSAAQRRERDAYYTALRLIRPLLVLVPEMHGALLGDPCCGDGRMARALGERFLNTYLNDINPDVKADTHVDAVEACDLERDVDFWVSNPPFFAAGDIVKAALRTARKGCAFLVRNSFLEPCGPSHLCREAKDGKPGIPCSPARCLRNSRLWLPELPPTRQIACKRESFTQDGKTDSAAAFWYVWLRGTDGRYQRGGIEVWLDDSQTNFLDKAVTIK